MNKTINLVPRLEQHYQNEIDYHERRREAARVLLDRLWLRSMGQLELFDSEAGYIEGVE